MPAAPSAPASAPAERPRKPKRMTRWRAASLLVVHVLAAIHFLHWRLAGRTLAPVEPSEMFDTIHLGVVTVGFLFALAAVVVTSFAGRFFCGWGCHILALQDLSAAILARLRVPVRPIRSRTLRWVPALAALYLFVWPQVERLARGEAPPPLHVVTDPEGWTSFTTTDLLRSFPGPVMSAATLLVCGFATVYFLGSRSFCWYACPYGAVFAAADRLAPLRVVAGRGECSSCGLCTAGCSSGVRVIEEVRAYGAVTDSACMRDLDCVRACPTGALTLAISTPTVLRPAAALRRGAGGRAAKPYDYTLGEDLVAGAVFAASVLVFRGLYEAISLLLALAMAGIAAAAAVLVLRLARRRGCRLGSMTLCERGRLTAAGRLFAAAALVGGALFAHSALIRYHEFSAARAIARLGAIGGADPAAAPDDVAGAELASASLATALDHLQAAADWGLVRPRGLIRRLAELRLAAGQPAASRRAMHELLAEHPADPEGRLLLARAWLADGRPELARREAESAARLVREPEVAVGPKRAARVEAGAARLLGDIALGEGDPRAAADAFARAVEADPTQPTLRVALGVALAGDGRLEEAAESFAQGVRMDPDLAAARNNLAAVLLGLGRPAEAVPHLERCTQLAPKSADAWRLLGEAQLAAGSAGQAAGSFGHAVDLDPRSKAAADGLRRARAAQE